MTQRPRCATPEPTRPRVRRPRHPRLERRHRVGLAGRTRRRWRSGNRNIGHPGYRLLPGRPRRLRAAEAAGAAEDRSSSSAARTRSWPRRARPPTARPKPRRSTSPAAWPLEGARARHPRQRRQPRRGHPRLAHLGRDVAQRARGQQPIDEDEIEDFYRQRSLLKRSVLSRGRRRGGLLLRRPTVRRSPPATSSTWTPATWPASPAEWSATAFELTAERHRAGERPAARPALHEDYDHLARQLASPRASTSRRLTARAAGLPGRRARRGAWAPGAPDSRASPAPASRATCYEKLDDCEAVHALVRVTPGISLHIPWDKPASDPAELKAFAEARACSVDSMNSNTFQDQPGQALSYKFGSLTPHRPRRARAGGRPQPRVPRPRADSSAPRSHTVWMGDGGNFPGQIHFRRALDRYLE